MTDAWQRETSHGAKAAPAKHKGMEAIGLEQQREVFLLHSNTREPRGVESWHA